MKNNTKVICALWVICNPSLISALVRSESYKWTKENDINFSFSLVNLGRVVGSKFQCFRHCNSDANCRGVCLVLEKKELTCFMMKNESAGQAANLNLADVQVNVKGNTYM